MFIHSLKIRSLRSLESAELKLQHPDRKDSVGLRAPNVNLLLGNNGAGKTTVLRAAALAALAPVMQRSSGYVPYHMVRQGKRVAKMEASLVLHKQDGYYPRAKPSATVRLSAEIRRLKDSEFLAGSRQPSKYAEAMFYDKSPAFLVVGYGATRRVEDAASFNANEQLKRRHLRYQRVAGLFESHISLTPLSMWLPRMKTSNLGRHNQVVSLLDQLLPTDTKFEGKQERDPDGEYLFRVRGVRVPFGALSDGYRAYIGWVADLLYHVCMGCPPGLKLVENRGLVLVDEIDLHLHPEWQRTVIGTISQALPNMQFIFTTHSPIVAGSAERENIFVMEFDRSGVSRVKQYQERIYGMDAQQVLLSSYFGLSTTRAPGFVDEMRDLSRKLKPGRPDIALEMMKKLAPEPTTASQRAAKPRARQVKRKTK